jgi:protein gp37
MSKIQWTDKTQNPLKVKTGGNYCELVSPGCANCYASGINKNPFFGGNGLAYGGSNQERPEMTLNTDMLASWARMRKSKKHFVCSMTDMFGEWVPDTYIFDILSAMAQASRQTFQILTKRPERMCYEVGIWLRQNGLGQIPANIWLGISAEDQKRYSERIIWLSRSLAQTRFLSLEPLLGPIDLTITHYRPEIGPFARPIRLTDWVIIGGESGPNARARPLDLAWIEDILRQCSAANIPVFVKQLGSAWAKAPGNHSKGGDPDEWPEHLRVRMFPGEAWSER